MRRSTSVKVLLLIVIGFLFSGFLLRAGVRLISAAMHSIFILALLLIVVIWVAAKLR
jgi:heme A synthase